MLKVRIYKNGSNTAQTLKSQCSKSQNRLIIKIDNGRE